MSMLSLLTGGSSDDAIAAQRAALKALEGVNTPSAESLSLPELEKYAVAAGMTPAEMQSFLQERNAYEDQDIDQTGTSAQKAALARLAEVADAGAEGDATSRAQVDTINQNQGRELAGQRGAIEQAARARGVPVGLLQAALSQNAAGQGAQNAHSAALQSQDQAYQRALSAMAQGGQMGNALQGQQNQQANTVAQAANAMQQFNAANQQNASANNASMKQQANATNTANINNNANANTNLSNEKIRQNSGVSQQVFNNNMAKATGVANQNSNLSNAYAQKGQQEAGLTAGLIGTGATLIGGPVASMAANAAMDQNKNKAQYAGGGMVEGGAAPMPGDHPMNDTVDARLSPGEAVIPRSVVQQNPDAVMSLLGQSEGGIDPQDAAMLLKALQLLRGAR